MESRKMVQIETMDTREKRVDELGDWDWHTGALCVK